MAWPVACSVPPATRETAKGDEANERDDNPDPQAHEENHHDSDDHDDAADGYTADSTFWCRHLCLLSLITHHTSAIVTAYTLWDFPTTDTLPSVGLATPQKMPLKRFRNGHNLDLLVDRRGRTGGVLQLLLAQTDRLKAF